MCDGLGEKSLLPMVRPPEEKASEEEYVPGPGNFALFSIEERWDVPKPKRGDVNITAVFASRA
jgi:hypothetical protein